MNNNLLDHLQNGAKAYVTVNIGTGLVHIPRLIRHTMPNLGSYITINNVLTDDDGNIVYWEKAGLKLEAATEHELDEKLTDWNNALHKPVLEVVTVDGEQRLVECKDQPNFDSYSSYKFWRKAVIYHTDKSGARIESRRPNDKPCWIKIRDYINPIMAYKAVENVDYPFYYVSRGDGLIVGSYSDSQVVREQPIEFMDWDSGNDARHEQK